MSSQTENKESSPAVSATEKANAGVEQPNLESKRQKYTTAVTKQHPPFVKMIQRGLNKCGKKSSDPGMNKAQLYHYLRETFGVTKGGSTPASVEKALHELRKAGKAKMLQRGVWKAGAEKKFKTKSLKSSKQSNVKCRSTLKLSKRATKTNSKKGSKK